MSEKVYVPVPPDADVVPFAAENGEEFNEIPEVVVIFDPPLTAISGLTRMVIWTVAIALTESVAVMVSRYAVFAGVVAATVTMPELVSIVIPA